MLLLVGGRHHVLDADGATESRPRRQSELGALVRGRSGRDPETRDPLNFIGHYLCISIIEKK